MPNNSQKQRIRGGAASLRQSSVHPPDSDVKPNPATATFSTRLLDWQTQHGRHDLPWQGTRDPYRVWLSEIMLQQTQVATVLPYYARFLTRFPTLEALATAPVEAVMPLWSGLGYYARARNLHACAQALMQAHGGRFPRDPVQLAQLPGIGRSTANAIAAVCFDAATPILDGNVKRVLCRHFGVAGFPGSAAVERDLWALAHRLVPAREAGRYNQAQMDLGATLCTRSRPRCAACPVNDTCVALASGRTAELPQARPRKPLPLREMALLLVINASGEVLLQRRPPTGVWGGLECLPLLDEGESPAEWGRRRLDATLDAVSPAPTFEHVFTHFRCRITPWHCRVGPHALAAEPGLRWLDLAAAQAAALPVPVRRILADYVADYVVANRAEK